MTAHRRRFRKKPNAEPAVTGASTADAELRAQCAKGDELYRKALAKAGYGAKAGGVGQSPRAAEPGPAP